MKINKFKFIIDNYFQDSYFIEVFMKFPSYYRLKLKNYQIKKNRTNYEK